MSYCFSRNFPHVRLHGNDSRRTAQLVFMMERWHNLIQTLNCPNVRDMSCGYSVFSMVYLPATWKN